MKVAKKVVGIILGLAFVFSCNTAAFADGSDIGRIIHGKDIVLDNVAIPNNGDEVSNQPGNYMALNAVRCGNDVVLTNVRCLHNCDFIAVTTNTKAGVKLESEMDRTYPEYASAKVFEYTIFDDNGRELATLTSTVAGVYSEYHHTAGLMSIKGKLAGASASKFSFSTSISGAIGTINLSFNGTSIGSFSYIISTNGMIRDF